MKFLTILSIGLFMSSAALAGSNGNCLGNDPKHRADKPKNIEEYAAQSLNIKTPAKRPKKIKGRK